MTAFGVQPRTEGSRFFPTTAKVVTIDRTAPLAPPRSREWTAVEIEVLREYAGQGSRAIARMLPGRTLNAIRVKCALLGIKCKRQPRRGTPHPGNRGKITIPAGAHPAVRACFEEMNRRKISFREMDRRTGLGGGTIADWRRNIPNLVNITAALNALGLDLAVVPKEPQHQKRIDAGTV